MAKITVVHYINQFFAQIGGEEKADYPAELRVGEVVGPHTIVAMISASSLKFAINAIPGPTTSPTRSSAG